MGHENFRPLRDRSFTFALDVTRFCRTLPETWEGRHVADQLFRAATSVASNYRAASRGRSLAEFISKLGTVVEECDESEFWLEFEGRPDRGRRRARSAAPGGERVAGDFLRIAGHGEGERTPESRSAPGRTRENAAQTSLNRERVSGGTVTS